MRPRCYNTARNKLFPGERVRNWFQIHFRNVRHETHVFCHTYIFCDTTDFYSFAKADRRNGNQRTILAMEAPLALKNPIPPL